MEQASLRQAAETMATQILHATLGTYVEVDDEEAWFSTEDPPLVYRLQNTSRREDPFLLTQTNDVPAHIAAALNLELPGRDELNMTNLDPMFGENTLFHYTSAKRLIEYISPEMRFRLGKMSDTNDPMESAINYVGVAVTRNATFEGMEDALQEIKALNIALRSGCSVGCFTLPADRVTDRPESQCPGHLHDRMWAEYGDGHKGVCLVFDKEKLSRAIHEHFKEKEDDGLGEVLDGGIDYVDLLSPPNSVRGAFADIDINDVSSIDFEAYLQAHREQFARALFFTKDTDWLSEREYRFVWVPSVGNVSATYESILIRGCIKAIILGHNFNWVYRVNLQQLRDNEDIPIWFVDYEGDRVVVRLR